MVSCSIIIAEYNNGKYFYDLYASIISQSITDFEVIIVDDHSTDNTVSIIEQTIVKDKRFKLIKHASNKGTGNTFKTAMEHATAEIIIMLGADDALSAEALKTIIDTHKQHPHASLINFALYHCDENLTIIAKSDFNDALQDNDYFYWISRGVDTFKRSKYLQTEGFDVCLKSAVDQDICFKLEETGEVIYKDDPVYLYRKNPKGISQEKNVFSARLNYFTAVFNTQKRRLKNGYKNISAAKFKSVKVEYVYCRAFVHDRKKEYVKSAGYLIYGYFLEKIYNVKVAEVTKKEIGYCIHHIVHFNRI